MKICIEIQHPSHVHHFKYVIREMRERGHEILITATEKDVAFRLLDNYGFDCVNNLESYGKSFIEKLVNIPILNLKIYLKVNKSNPDVFISLGSIRAANASFLFHMNCILLENTERFLNNSYRVLACLHPSYLHLILKSFSNRIDSSREV